MRLERVILPAVFSGTLALLSSCGTAPVKEESLISVSAEQIQQIANYDELLTLYRSASSALQGKDPTLFASDFASLKTMAGKLVALKKQDLSEQFDAARLSSGEVPMGVLTAAHNDAKTPPVTSGEWQQISDLINGEWSKTEDVVNGKIAELQDDDMDADTRLVTMDDLYRLTGSQTWLDQRNTYVDELIEEIREARANGILTAELQPKIDLVLENRSDDTALQEEFVAVSAEIYQQDYFKALSDGDADTAYAVFLKMSESKNFDAIKKNLADSSEKMATYFVAAADESVKDPENLAQSYRWYSQARTVTKKLGIKSKAPEGHDILIEQLDDKYKEYIEAEVPTIALAYLHFIKEFRPLYKGLRQKLSETEEKVRSEAIKRLSTTAFDGGSSAAGYGDIISSKVTQYLFTHVPNDVRIVEREQYEALQREREIGGGTSGLAAVDLIVTGSVLEAKVDSTEQKGKKTIRAVVGKETIPNQAYIKWLELSAKDRKNIEKPSDTITIDKEENIPVNETRHRKVGIFSVSYRLVDAENGRVLFPDSHTEQEEHTGVSQEGVEMGDFKRDFKLAELPSNVKILDTLANKVAKQIGTRLVERLKDQEKRYLAEAEDFKKDNSCTQHADRLAKALVILDAKGMDSKGVFSEYKDVVINCDGS